LTERNKWVEKLLQWFDRTGRALPWREQKPRNPYHVWVSEIMLQQTRVDTVKTYFTEWMRRFPTIDALARAPEEEVLRLWQGLGYYSRARNLHRAAREVLLQWGGTLPRTREALRTLPGIGDYTAGAICSMAFGQKTPAVDGNLLRVLARLYALDEDVLSLAGRRKITGLAEKVIPAARPGDFNEALMDLGALICIPLNPHCDQCPLAAYCQGFQQHRASELPVRKKKAPQKEFHAVCLLVQQENAILLHKRPDKGLLASLWELPTFLAPEKNDCLLLARENFGTFGDVPLWCHKHVFSHQIWYMEAYEAETPAFPLDASYRWVAADELSALPLSGPCQRFFQDLREKRAGGKNKR
jgi:A/G-specific adenine glycosylase